MYAIGDTVILSLGEPEIDGTEATVIELDGDTLTVRYWNPTYCKYSVETVFPWEIE